jgi:hypothetical protein
MFSAQSRHHINDGGIRFASKFMAPYRVEPEAIDCGQSKNIYRREVVDVKTGSLGRTFSNAPKAL